MSIKHKGIYLFIIWQKGRKVEDRIREDLGRRFRILKEYEVCWKRRHSIRNFAVLYRHIAFFSWLNKCWVCGTGPFRMIMVEDDGMADGEAANKRIIEAKRLYRRWAGKRWRVHSSACLAETRYQYWLLAGKTLEAFAAEKHDGSVERIRIERPLRFELGLLA